MLPDDDGGGVPCDNCAAQRALLHCAQLGTRLCLPCDVPVHAAAAFHERAPLCERCHAAAAAGVTVSRSGADLPTRADLPDHA